MFAARGGGSTVDLLRSATLDISALLAITNERNDEPVGDLVGGRSACA